MEIFECFNPKTEPACLTFKEIFILVTFCAWRPRLFDFTALYSVVPSSGPCDHVISDGQCDWTRGIALSCDQSEFIMTANDGLLIFFLTFFLLSDIPT